MFAKVGFFMISPMPGALQPSSAAESFFSISAPLGEASLISCSPFFQSHALISETAERKELPNYGQPWTDAQRERLLTLANAKADEYEAQGRTGHPLLWQRHRGQILGILEWMLDEDNRWRAQQNARVLASELPFGLKGEEPVELPIGDGRAVRFRGAADKVDDGPEDP